MTRKPPVLEDHPASFADARAAGLTRGSCMHVVDGDTADFLLDLGWYQYAYVSLRLANADAAELRGGTAAAFRRAVRARERLTKLLMDRAVLVESHKEQSSFSRFIADVYIPATSVNPRPRAGTRRIGGVRWIGVAGILVQEGFAKRRRA
jgi:endonuclease YncB( thermonuclease family)